MKRKRRSTFERKRLDQTAAALERCRNPWNGECTNTDIALYIFYEAERLPICGECWDQIASQNVEWRYE